MKTIDPTLGITTYRAISRPCEYDGCSLTTREGKPFCSDHVEYNTHASQVLKEIATREAEDELVLRHDTPVSGYNISGITAQSIIQQLAEHGTRTAARLCRELSIDREVLDCYVEALVEQGCVTLGRTNRRNLTLTLRRRQGPGVG